MTTVVWYTISGSSGGLVLEKSDVSGCIPAGFLLAISLHIVYTCMSIMFWLSE
jgi:hypothetical protein